MFAAILDTCVLWPSLQRDALLSLAVDGLYRPLWSSAILDELEFPEARKLERRGEPADLARRRAARLVSRMNDAFDDACVNGWEPLDGTYGLPDPDDEHLIAAAEIGGAGVIVSDNLKDLPEAHLPVGIHVRTARDFATDTISVDPARALAALSEMSVRLRHPALTLDELLELLVTRYRWHEAVSLVREAATRGHGRPG